MLKTVIKSLPSWKTILILYAFSLLLGFWRFGMDSNVLLLPALVSCIIMLLTLRNYDPAGMEMIFNPTSFILRDQCQELYAALDTLVSAIEADTDLVGPDVLVVRAHEARELLNSYKQPASAHS